MSICNMRMNNDLMDNQKGLFKAAYYATLPL